MSSLKKKQQTLRISVIVVLSSLLDLQILGLLPLYRGVYQWNLVQK